MELMQWVWLLMLFPSGCMNDYRRPEKIGKFNDFGYSKCDTESLLVSGHRRFCSYFQPFLQCSVCAHLCGHILCVATVCRLLDKSFNGKQMLRHYFTREKGNYFLIF